MVKLQKNGIITESHFKKNLNQAPKAMSLALQDMKKITNAIRKKFFYQPMMPYHEAEELLLSELNKFKNKQVRINQSIKYNAVMAGFVSADRILRQVFFILKMEKSSKKIIIQGQFYLYSLMISVLIPIN